MIEFIGVSRIFSRGRGIRDISLQVKKGEWVVLAGSTGAGKTTMLRHVYAAEKPDSGEVIVGGFHLSGLKRNQTPRVRRMLGIVDQDLSLMFDRTVERNVSLVGEVLGWDRKKTREKTLRVLNQVGLFAHLDANPLTLSYGERRRLALARALVGEPYILIADEPLGHLDRETGSEIIELLRRIHARGATLFITTHRLELFEGQPIRVVNIENGSLVQ